MEVVWSNRMDLDEGLEDREELEVKNLLLWSKLQGHEDYVSELQGKLVEKESTLEDLSAKVKVLEAKNEQNSLQHQAEIVEKLCENKLLTQKIKEMEETEVQIRLDLQKALDEKVHEVNIMDLMLKDLELKVESRTEEKDHLEVEAFLLRSKLNSNENYLEEVKKLLAKEKVYQSHLKDEFVKIQSGQHGEAISAKLQIELETSLKKIRDLQDQLSQIQMKFALQSATQQDKIEDLKCENFLLRSKLCSYQTSEREMTEQKLQLAEEKESFMKILEAEKARNSYEIQKMKNAFEAETKEQIQHETRKKDAAIEAKTIVLKDLAKTIEALDEIKVENFLLRSKIASFEMAQEEMKKYVMHDHEENRLKNEELLTLRKSFEDLQRERAKNNDEVTRLKEAFEEKKITLDRCQKIFQRQLYQKEEEIQKIRDELRKGVSRTEELEVVNFMLESKIGSYKIGQEESRKVVDKEKSKVKTLSAQNMKLLQHLEEEKSKNKGSNNELGHKDEEIQKLNKAIQEREMDLQKAKADIGRIKEEKDQKEEAINNLKNSLQSLQMSMESNEGKISALEQDLIAKEKDFKETLNKLHVEHDQRLTKFKLSSEEELEKAREEFSMTQNELKRQFEMVQLEKKMELETMSIDKKRLEEEQSKLEQMLTEKESQIGELQKHYEQILESKSAVEQHVLKEKEELEAVLIGEKTKVLELNTQVEASNASLEAEKKNFLVLEAKKEALEKKVAHLEGELSEANESLEKQILDNQSLEEEIEELKSSDKLIKNEYKDLLSEKKQLENDKEILLGQKESLQGSLGNLENTLKESQDKLQRNQEEINCLEKERQEALTQLAEVQKAKNELENLLKMKDEEFNESLDQLEKDLISKSKDCEESQEENAKLRQTVEDLQQEFCQVEQKLQTSEASETKLKDEMQALKREKDSKVAKIRLLLGNQKKLEEELKSNQSEFEDFMKATETLKQRVEECDGIEEQLKEMKAKVEDYEREENKTVMPWEIDPELKEMSAMELRSILGAELSPKEKATLNEMCVQELEKELNAKTKQESNQSWEIVKLKKELQKAQFRVTQMQNQQNTIQDVIGHKRKSMDGDEEPREESRVTRSNKKMRKNVDQENASLASTVSTRASKRAKSSGLVKLDREMPANPFGSAKKKNTTTTKKPLETITNKS